MLLDQPKLHLDSKLVAPSVVWLVYVRPPYSLIQHVARLGYLYGYKPIAINLSSTNPLIRIAGVPAYPGLMRRQIVASTSPAHSSFQSYCSACGDHKEGWKA